MVIAMWMLGNAAVLHHTARHVQCQVAALDSQGEATVTARSTQQDQQACAVHCGQLSCALDDSFGCCLEWQGRTFSILVSLCLLLLAIIASLAISAMMVTFWTFQGQHKATCCAAKCQQHSQPQPQHDKSAQKKSLAATLTINLSPQASVG